MVAGLAAKYRVYALDSVMDLGRSVRSRDAKNADDLCAWLDEVLQALGLGPEVRLMGMSHGGWLAANFATRFPERLKQLVLLAPAAWVEDLPTSLIFRMLLMFLPPRRYWMRRIYRATLPDLAATAQGPALIDAMTEDLALAFECYPLRELGKMPSSIPGRKTTGNSRPLALCSVIIVTTDRPPSMLSRSVTSATFSKKSCSVVCSRLIIKSAAALRNSFRFSSLLRDSSSSCSS